MGFISRMTGRFSEVARIELLLQDDRALFFLWNLEQTVMSACSSVLKAFGSSQRSSTPKDLWNGSVLPSPITLVKSLRCREELSFGSCLSLGAIPDCQTFLGSCS